MYIYVCVFFKFVHLLYFSKDNFKSRQFKQLNNMTTVQETEYTVHYSVF